ncbi:MAG TPA: glycosyltransferase family 39 protein [Tepidisphaeraceae bacterium]|nr:glycosyltransferase family 39 protein [Tepidisphaeraceae bacterium]
MTAQPAATRDVNDRTPGAEPSAPPPLLRVPRVLAWVGLVGVFFAAVAPTLNETEFSSGLENLVIGTALELRRDHAPTLAPEAPDGRPGWLVPTLEEEPRVKKPPLTPWITALAITDATLRDLANRDPAVHEPAWLKLAWQARWPTLLAACLMLIATYELGRAVSDPTTALIAAIACGTSVMFLRYGRSAIIDVHLGLWVALANLGLAHAVLHGRRWAGLTSAGLCLGVVMMLKGPVGLVQTVLPVLVYAIWTHVAARRRLAQSGEAPPPSTGAGRRWAGPIAVCVLLMIAVAAPWYVAVARLVPGATAEWFGEFSAVRGERPSRVYTYGVLFILLFPWTITFVSGAIAAAVRRRGPMLLALSLAIVPVLAMTVYKDRKDRYLLPVLPACAIVAAHGLMELARKRTWTGLDKAAVAQHWALLVVVGVVLPAAAATVLGTKWLPTDDGTPWLARPWGAGLTIGLGLLLAGGMLVRRQWLATLLGATIVVMLAGQAAIMPGYGRTYAGQSPMKPIAQAVWESAPTADLYNAHPTGKRADVSLSIYANRPTRWISTDDLKTLPPANRPKVVLFKQGPGEPEPEPPTPAWSPMGKTRRDKDWWWAFVLAAK